MKDGNQLLAFIDARGGCGKTFMTNVILASVRSSEPGGCVALATATTGIAANLLDLGRTFHSRFKAPLTLSEDSTLQISGQSSLGNVSKKKTLNLGFWLNLRGGGVRRWSAGPTLLTGTFESDLKALNYEIHH